ncbi:hypothetical protein ANO11243_083020 [Dothideomycetidae sp. 11243]|nr:hypothetical protein ANO11243_083020 [fungal sp. No.11243]
MVRSSSTTSRSTTSHSTSSASHHASTRASSSVSQQSSSSSSATTSNSSTTSSLTKSKSMVHLATPGPDTGRFDTNEVRPSSKPSKSTSRIIALPRGPSGKPHYKSPPNLAAGFSSLHLSGDRSAIRANLVADDFTVEKFRITIETWGEAKLFSAAATWIEHASSARDCIFGQFDTADCKGTSKQQEYSRHVRFPRSFAAPPAIVCWLNRLDMGAGGERNWRLRAYSSDVTKQGFTAHIDAWADTALAGGAMAWIAFPAGKAKVDSGRFATTDVRSWSEPRERTTGKVSFQTKFERPPTVLAALDMLDAAGNADLRVKVTVQDVTTSGFMWSLDTWDDSTLYAAGAGWIALGIHGTVERAQAELAGQSGVHFGGAAPLAAGRPFDDRGEVKRSCCNRTTAKQVVRCTYANDACVILSNVRVSRWTDRICGGDFTDIPVSGARNKLPAATMCADIPPDAAGASSTAGTLTLT